MPSPTLPGVFAGLAPVLDQYGYLAVAGFVLAEDFGVPLPGETVLIAAAVYAGAGQLSVVLVGLVALVAAVVGDNIGYGLGRWGGRRLVLRFGQYVLLTEKRLDAAERWFDRHGSKVVVVARFIEGLRQANGWIAGITGMRWRRFALFNAVGAVLWVGTWLTIGYVAGGHIDSVYGAIRRYLIYVVVGVAVLIVVITARHVIVARRDRRDPNSPEGEHTSPPPCRNAPATPSESSPTST